MFHHHAAAAAASADPLSSLSAASYGRSCGSTTAAGQAAAAAAHHVSSAYGSMGGGMSQSTGESCHVKYLFFGPLLKLIVLFSGVLSPGLSVPLQVPGQTSDLTANYWPKIQ